jgi:hypothetical protein
MDLNDAVFNQQQDREKTQLEQTHEFLQKLQAAFEEYSVTIVNLFGAISARRLQNIDLEIKALEEQTRREIELAGDNDRAKEQIERNAEARKANLERKRRAEQQKQARLEKAQGIVSVGIQTAINVVEAFPNFALMALAAALGAIQVATIAAKPIPQFEEGGVTKTPTIIAGEAGSELYRTPSGKFGITPDTATVMKLPVGTEIFPHDETLKMLAMGSLRRVDSVRADYALYAHIDGLKSEIRDGNKALIKAVIESAPGDLVSQGSLVYEAKRRVDGSKKLIRRKSMGY